jgi:hypothetical protein
VHLSQGVCDAYQPLHDLHALAELVVANDLLRCSETIASNKLRQE